MPVPVPVASLRAGGGSLKKIFQLADCVVILCDPPYFRPLLNQLVILQRTDYCQETTVKFLMKSPVVGILAAARQYAVSARVVCAPDILTLEQTLGVRSVRYI